MSSQNLLDTPTRRATQLVTTRTKKMDAKTHRNMAKIAIENNTYVVEKRAFIEKKFPFKELAELVYSRLVGTRVYDEMTKKWAGAPKKDAPESDYYPFFNKLCALIMSAREEIAGNCPPSFRCTWEEIANKTPLSLETLGTAVRPDVVAVARSLVELVEKIDKQIAAVGQAGKMTKKQKQELEETLGVWWSRIVVAVEVKKAEKPVEEDLAQLVTYLQHMLREQLDRRSALGLLFWKTHLGIWQADRSGIIGTADAFDIHKEPRLFIQVILGCSFGKPSDLGWDTTMQIWRGPQTEPLASFHPDLEAEYFKKRNIDKNWIISMPKKDTKTEREDFLTIRAISTARAGCISGRATVVWVVMKLADVGKSDHEIFVLKQSWQPITATPEADLIPRNVSYISQVYSSEVVHDGVKEVDTVRYLRSDMKHEVPEVTEDPAVEKAQVKWTETLEKEEARVMVVAEFKHLEHIYEEPVSRVHMRIVIEDFGWAIHRFRDLGELLCAIKHVVKAQKEMYFDHNTLQRDVSMQNILICPSGSKDLQKMRGSLIDFDYAKKTEATMPCMLDAVHGLRIDQASTEATQQRAKADSLDIFKDYENILDPMFGLYLNKVTLRRFYHLRFQNIQGNTEDVVVPAALGLLPVNSKVPDFTERGAQSRERSATFPFASCEILVSSKVMAHAKPKPTEQHSTWEDLWDYLMYFEPFNQDRTFYHDACHDIEALFWVFTYICLTRAGPGGAHRDNQPEVPTGSKRERRDEPRTVTNKLFDSINQSLELLSLAKKGCLVSTSPEQYTKHFTPFFDLEPMRTLWIEWRDIVVAALTYPFFEQMHDTLLNAIERAIKSLPDETHSKASQKVDEDRKEELDFYRNFASEMQAEEAIPLAGSHDASPDRFRNSSQTTNLEDPPSPTQPSKKQKTSKKSKT